jgi:hypothetical protein
MTEPQLFGGLVGIVALAGLLILYGLARLGRWLNGCPTLRDFRAEIREENLDRIHAARYKRL